MLSQHLLFVYGTLKRGYSRHFVLRDAKFRCSAVTVDGHRLFDCGSYPGLVPSNPGLAVRGEVYGVSDECLATCDEVEGVSHGLYLRQQISVRQRSDPDITLLVWAYLYCQPTDELPDCGVEWPCVDLAESEGPGFST